MKIKSMLIAFIIVLGVTTQTFAQGYASDEDLNQAMCVLDHVRNALQAEANHWVTTNTTDFKVALDILEKYKNDPTYAGYTTGTGGGVIGVAALYSFWKSRKFISLDELAIFRNKTEIFAAALKGTDPEKVLALLYTSAKEYNSTIFLREAIYSPKVSLVTDMALFSVYKNIPEMEKLIRELETLLPEARKAYTESLIFTDLIERVNDRRQSGSFVRAQNIAIEIDRWTSDPRNLGKLKTAISETLNEASFNKFTKEVTHIETNKLFAKEEIFAREANSIKWGRSAKIFGAFGAVVIIGSVAYEVFYDYEPENITPEILNMKTPDLRAYLRKLPDDVAIIKQYAKDVGCDQRLN